MPTPSDVAIDNALANLAARISGDRQAFGAGIFVDLLAEKAVRISASRATQQEAIRSRAFGENVWNIDMIAAYLIRSPRAISERIMHVPGFPEPVANCVDPIHESEATDRPRPWWLASEIMAWVLSYKADVAPENRVSVEWEQRERLLLESIGTAVKRDHRHVRKTRIALSEGCNIAPAAGILHVVVSQASRERALRLMNTLLALFDRRGIGYWVVGSVTLVGVPHHTLEMRLDELQPSESEVGRLRISLYRGLRQVYSIEDGLYGPLEGRLSRLVVHLTSMARRSLHAKHR